MLEFLCFGTTLPINPVLNPKPLTETMKAVPSTPELIPES